MGLPMSLFGQNMPGVRRQNDAYLTSQELIASMAAQAQIEVARLNNANVPNRTPGAATVARVGGGRGGGGPLQRNRPPLGRASQILRRSNSSGGF